MSRNLTVFGATGGTGTQLVRQALEAGDTVTAVVRDPARMAIREHERLTVTVADVTDPEALRPLVAGRDAVLSGLGAPSNKAAGIASRAARAIVEAQEATGVRRHIGLSAAPLGPVAEGETLLYRSVLFPLVSRVLRDVYADLALMEGVISASTLEWTVLRPPKLTDKPSKGAFRREIGGSVYRGHSLPRADLAAAMLGVVDDKATVGQVVGVAS